MRIKSFIASSVQEALSNIKKEMGESSIILETRNIEDDDVKAQPGQDLVEIVAAEMLADKEKSEGGEGNEESCFSVYEHTPEEQQQHLPKQDMSDCFDIEWPEAGKEWFLLLCEQQVECEIAKVLIKEMLGELDNENLERLDVQREKMKEIIIRKIESLPSENFIEMTNKPMVFIGASGTGKTTTLSKLARNVRSYSGNEILLISIENDYVEKLNRVAMEIGATVVVVKTPQELRIVQDEFRNSTHIFIEAPGMGYKDNKSLLALRKYMDVIPNSAVQLVLNTTTRLKDISPLVDEKSRISIHGILFTKMDEASTFGALLNMVMKSERPVSYISHETKLSGDMMPVTANMIAELIIN